ncbi:HAD family hydrolase [Alicyclobacillus vulcanalis]|uniref:Putative hydrolase of the HAD superfamily n=1 Tax=Alicyclobacillus vulcanalis TaxID=252246 RepID=A0A1N7JUB5_9BACL|nr:HAD family phosphatase [Alicyclobacillus vulcanalis]SIS52952.1 putative hydrolase of the HAD superfamily [Alicyclobacillus vulcanalis]
MKAVIFDFDGTLLDTERAWWEAYSALYRRHGRQFPSHLYAKTVGTTNDAFDPIQHLCEAETNLKPGDAAREVEAAHRELLEGEPLRPGVRASLEELHRLGIAIGLATSSHRAYVEPFLVQHRIRDFFAVVATADDVEQVKPHPALYQLACQRLGVAPRNALAVEDSPNGAQAAIAAGLHVLCVPNALTQQMAFPDGCHFRRSLEGLDWEMLIASLLKD